MAEKLTVPRAAGVDWHIAMEKEIDDDKTLLLAWVFGGSHFVRMLSRVAHKATLNDKGILLDTRGQPWKDHGLPPAIIGMKPPDSSSFL